MKKRWIIVLIVIPCVVFLAGYAAYSAFLSPPAEPTFTGPTRTVTDMASQKVKIPATPDGILSMSAAATDTIIALGAGNRLSGVGMNSKYFPNTAGLRAVGRRIKRRHISALGIDMALVPSDHEELLKNTEKLALPAMQVRCQRASQVPELIDFLGRFLELPDRATHLKEQVTRFMDVAAQTNERAEKRPKVYLELDRPFMTVGSGTYPDDLIRLAGGRNVAAGKQGGARMTAEQLKQAQPDVILFVDQFATRRSVTRRSGMSELDAVRNGQVYGVKLYWMLPGPSMMKVVSQMRELLGTQPLPFEPEQPAETEEAEKQSEGEQQKPTPEEADSGPGEELPIPPIEAPAETRE